MLEEDGQADLVLIMTGTNDLGMSTSLPTIVHQVAQLHSICHDRGIPTVAIAATQGSGRKCRSLRQNLADLVAKWACATAGVLDFVDVEDLVPRPVGKDGVSSNASAAVHWEADDLHLSAAGSTALGRRLASHAALWLQKLGKEGTKISKNSALNAGVGAQAGTPRLAQQPLSNKISGSCLVPVMKTSSAQHRHNTVLVQGARVQRCR
jgi:hypothetical protein